MDIVARLVAAALGLVFAWAAIAKLTNRQETAAGFGDLGLPAADRLAVAVPLMELALSAALFFEPAWGGVLAFAVLIGFSAHLAGLIRSGQTVACRCFGGTSTDPVSLRTLARNGALIAAAGFCAFAG